MLPLRIWLRVVIGGQVLENAENILLDFLDTTYFDPAQSPIIYEECFPNLWAEWYWARENASQSNTSSPWCGNEPGGSLHFDEWPDNNDIPF